jgi:hypothetical protein
MSPSARRRSRTAGPPPLGHQHSRKAAASGRGGVNAASPSGRFLALKISPRAAAGAPPSLPAGTDAGASSFFVEGDDDADPLAPARRLLQRGDEEADDGKLSLALTPRRQRAAASAVEKVPSYTRTPRTGSRISARPLAPWPLPHAVVLPERSVLGLACCEITAQRRR